MIMLRLKKKILSGRKYLNDPRHIGSV